MIYSDNPHADWFASSLSKFHNLILQIAYHTVDLLDHGLCKNLHFDTNLNCSHKSSRDPETFIDNWSLSGNDFPEGSVSSPCGDTVSLILDIQHTPPVLNFSDQFRRPSDLDEIFV